MLTALAAGNWLAGKSPLEYSQGRWNFQGKSLTHTDVRYTGVSEWQESRRHLQLLKAEEDKLRASTSTFSIKVSSSSSGPLCVIHNQESFIKQSPVIWDVLSEAMEPPHGHL